ncbi:RluA family pseudouridine synthase [Arsukibacterium sp.]|uniref:RluA family pseudouridine synthase n=1 Tax=Arsukibacterium sp. TaxID=1977258 RepID=UPI002FD9E5B5
MPLIRQFEASTAINAIDLLVAAVPELSKGRLKDAMNKGAVQLMGKPVKRLRRAQTPLPAGARLQLHYDEALLQRQATTSVLLDDQGQFSLWFKPAGVLSQGNEWGDHLSLLRHAEQHFSPARHVFLLHRLDREASGLVLLAHSKKAAAAFSQLIARRQIEKHYHIQVQGLLAPDLLAQGVITQPLDGKPCRTEFTLLSTDVATQSSWLAIRLISGRKHQIRRHFAAIGHPVMGDPRYGQQNKSANGLALQAVSLSFQCPIRQHLRQYQLPAQWCIKPALSTAT